MMGLITVQDLFHPKQFSGLQFWFDASQITGVADGAAMPATWSDLSGNGHNLTRFNTPTFQATGLNGLPTVRLANGYFDGPNNIKTTSGPLYAFIVSQRSASQASAGAADDYQRLLSAWDSTSSDDFLGTGWALQGANDGSGNAIAYTVDIRQVLAASGKTIHRLSVGRNSYAGPTANQELYGDISEIIVWAPSVAWTDEAEWVKQWLRRKWKIA